MSVSFSNCVSYPKAAFDNNNRFKLSMLSNYSNKHTRTNGYLKAYGLFSHLIYELFFFIYVLAGEEKWWTKHGGDDQRVSACKFLDVAPPDVAQERLDC